MPKKLRIQPTKVLRDGKKRWRVIIPVDLRKDVREKFFTTEASAQLYARNLELERGGHGVSPFLAMAIPLQVRIWRCYEQFGCDIEAMEAATGTAVGSKASENKPLEQVIVECVDVKRRIGCSEEYVVQFEDVLNIFKRGREAKAIAAISSTEIEDWLHDPEWSGWTRRGYLGRVRTLFSFAQKRGYVRSNPAAAVEMPAVSDTPIGIITLKQGEALLRAAMEIDRELALRCALQMFGFLRPGEVARLHGVDFTKDDIEVAGPVAKTRQRRVILINATLRAWINACPPLTAIHKERLRIKMDKVRTAAGALLPSKTFPWSHDCLRHTCVSCAYPIHGARQTSEWAGHSETILFRHYRALVAKKEAEAWWELTPSKLGVD